MNKSIAGALVCAAVIAGCSDEDVIIAKTGTATPNAGIVAFDHISIIPETVNVDAIDTSSNIFTKTDITVTVQVGDRNNRVLTDTHVIFFESEFGLIDPSCTTDSTGTCEVTWSIIKRPLTGELGADDLITLTAYTIGEESFVDANDNGTYDNGESFTDIGEPFLNNDGSFDNSGPFPVATFTAGDGIIDVANTADPAGTNATYDGPDGAFNGPGCTHPTACSPRTGIFVYDQTYLDIEN